MRELVLALCLVAAGDALADANVSANIGPVGYSLIPHQAGGPAPTLEFVQYWAYADAPLINHGYDDVEAHGINLEADETMDTLSVTSPSEWPFQVNASMTGLLSADNRNLSVDATLVGPGRNIPDVWVYASAAIEFWVPAHTTISLQVPMSAFAQATPTAGSNEALWIASSLSLFIDSDAGEVTGGFDDWNKLSVATNGLQNASASEFLFVYYINDSPRHQFGTLWSTITVGGSSTTSPVTSPVPEPRQWSMLAAGCMLMGVMMARRRKPG